MRYYGTFQQREETYERVQFGTVIGRLAGAEWSWAR